MFKNYNQMLEELLQHKLHWHIKNKLMAGDPNDIVFYYNLICMPPKWDQHHNPLMHSKIK